VLQQNASGSNEHWQPSALTNAMVTPQAVTVASRSAEDETLADVITEYAAACRRSNELAADYELDDLVAHHLVGTVSLRFVYLGMIAEVARHAGHADILAEQIESFPA
jgi:hypothetical protein